MAPAGEDETQINKKRKLPRSLPGPSCRLQEGDTGGGGGGGEESGGEGGEEGWLVAFSVLARGEKHFKDPHCQRRQRRWCWLKEEGGKKNTDVS